MTPFHLQASLWSPTHPVLKWEFNHKGFFWQWQVSSLSLSLSPSFPLSLSLSPSFSLYPLPPSLSLPPFLSLSSPCDRSHSRSYHSPHGEGHCQREPVSDACVGRGRQASLHGLPEGPRQTHLLPTLRQTSAALFGHFPHHYSGIHCESAWACMYMYTYT